MTDNDLEILEAYLDDSLSDQELASVAKRIATEPHLAEMIESLRADRDLRKAAFISHEPRDADVERLLGRIDESIRRSSVSERRSRWLRVASAMAACILLSFVTGYMSHSPSVVGKNAPTDAGIFSSGNTPSAQKYAVRLTDSAGHVVATQQFDSLEKAQEFVTDFRQWQERQRQMQNGNVVYMGQHF